MKHRSVLTALTLFEILLATTAVALDILIPAAVIIVLGLVFLLIRRENLSVFGAKKAVCPGRMALYMLGCAALWTVVDYGLLMPALNHLTGTAQNLSAYEGLKGNLPQLALYLAAGWILGGFLEEFAFRGVLQTRVASLFSGARAGVFASVLITSVLFGFLHTEQGIVGVVITTVDALFFSFLKQKYQNTWASALAHGFMNTIGIVTIFFTGPIYGLW